MSESKRPQLRGLPIPIPDSESCPAGMAKIIDGLLLGETPSAKDQRRLDDALASDPAVKAYYDRAMFAERLLDGGPEALFTPTAAQFERLEGRVLEAARLEAEAEPEKEPARQGIFAWVASLVAVGAAIAIGLPMFLRAHNSQPEQGPRPVAHRSGEFQTRGTPPKRGEQVGLRVFCIAKEDQGKAAVTELREDAPKTPSCSLQATLRFAYSNRSALKHLFVVGVDERGKVLWYSPAPPQTHSLAATVGVDRPLPRAVALDVNHRAGALRIFALFSKEALDAKAVATAAAKLKKGSLSSQKLLPMEDTEQRSILLELRP